MRLLRGEEVTADGHVRVDRARLWTLPDAVPPRYRTALSEETARWCGAWADGLLTVAVAPEQLRKIVAAFRASRPVSMRSVRSIEGSLVPGGRSQLGVASKERAHQ